MNYDENFFARRFQNYTDEELIEEYFFLFDCDEKMSSWKGDCGPVLGDVVFDGFSAVKDEMALRFISERETRTETAASPSADTPLVSEG